MCVKDENVKCECLETKSDLNMFLLLLTALLSGSSSSNPKIESFQTEIAELKGRLDTLEKMLFRTQR